MLSCNATRVGIKRVNSIRRWVEPIFYARRRRHAEKAIWGRLWRRDPVLFPPDFPPTFPHSGQFPSFLHGVEHSPSTTTIGQSTVSSDLPLTCTKLIALDRLGSGVRVNASFQKIPRLMGRLKSRVSMPCWFSVALTRSGLFNVVTLRYARLVPRWVTVFRRVNHPGVEPGIQAYSA